MYTRDEEGWTNDDTNEVRWLAQKSWPTATIDPQAVVDSLIEWVYAQEVL